ncbi:MAG: hypothetical protein ACP6IY_16415 [Promethearchaeia archaeon]
MSEKIRKEDIELAAYYISQKGYTYDELCWKLAEKQLMEEKILNEPSDDTLKFFINWIQEMIELGGPNLPKTISSQLGAKLAKVYKERGILDIEQALKKSYEAIKGHSEIRRIDESTIEVKNAYLRDFCPIGGQINPEKAKIMQESICIPFTMSFLNGLDPHYRYEGTVHECILKSGGNVCRYTLKIEKKDNK